MEMLRLLLEFRPELDKRGDDGMTPLHYAARYSKRGGHAAARSREGSRSGKTESGLMERHFFGHDTLSGVDSCLFNNIFSIIPYYMQFLAIIPANKNRQLFQKS